VFFRVEDLSPRQKSNPATKSQRLKDSLSVYSIYLMLCVTLILRVLVATFIYCFIGGSSFNNLLVTISIFCILSILLI